MAVPCLALPCLAVPCRPSVAGCPGTRCPRLTPCVLHYVILTCAVPCRAVPCRAVPCRAVPCRAVPCRAVPCLAVPCRPSVAGCPGARCPWLTPRVLQYVIMCFIMLASIDTRGQAAIPLCKNCILPLLFVMFIEDLLSIVAKIGSLQLLSCTVSPVMGVVRVYTGVRELLDQSSEEQDSARGQPRLVHPGLTTLQERSCPHTRACVVIML